MYSLQSNLYSLNVFLRKKFNWGEEKKKRIIILFNQMYYTMCRKKKEKRKIGIISHLL